MDTLTREGLAGARPSWSTCRTRRRSRTGRLQESGYFRAKQAQEELIRESGASYSIVRATQFFEFVNAIAAEATDGDTVRLAPVGIQPVASDDVAAAVARTAVNAPVNAHVEVAGPAVFRLDELVREALAAQGDPRTVVTSPDARYFGTALGETTLLPGPDARLGEVAFGEWVARQR